jgi:hypothetical protein
MELAGRLAALEERVAALEGQGPDPKTFGALHGLRDRLPDKTGGVLFTGALTALGHPVRLLLLHLSLSGMQSTAELQDNEALGAPPASCITTCANWYRPAGCR